MDPTQENSQPAASVPTPVLSVRAAPGVRVSTAEVELLAQAFADSPTIFIKREFRSGYSGALVLLIALGADRAPVVVKLSHPRDLQREYEAYQQFVRQISPQNIAHLQGEPLVSADGQLGLLQYSFAGGESHLPAASLYDYYQSKGGDACAAVLNRIFRAFGRYWWANNRPHLYALGEQYDRLLPVHLQVAKAKPDGEPSVVLENGKTGVMALRTVDVGQFVRLLGFEVTKVSTGGRKVTLTALPPPNEASAPLRVRLEFGDLADVESYKPGDVVEALDTVVVATRLTLLRDAAVGALPSFDLDAKTFSADIGNLPASGVDTTLLNPLYDLSDLLDSVVETKTSVIHGDLNLQNVLVDTPTGFSWIIDFGETRRGPTVLDLQRLEVQVITKLLPTVWRDAQLDLAVLVTMLFSLHTDSLPLEPPHPAIHEPFRVLVMIRRLARQYLIDDLNWDEYYAGLVVALVGALKYDELEGLDRQLALVAAAAAQSLVGHRLSILHSPAQPASATPGPAATPHMTTLQPPPPAGAALPAHSPNVARTRNLGIGAVVIALLAGLVTWQLWSARPLRSTHGPTPPATETSVVTTSGEATEPSLTNSSALPATSAPTATGTATEEAPTIMLRPTTANAGDLWVNPIDGATYGFVPEGEFIMGSDNGNEDTQPSHTVNLASFWIMRTEVTNEQYKQCVDAGACTAPANDRWNDSAFAQHPVVQVSWQQAHEYAAWAGGRLPTEAEWEKAARGTDGRAYPWGDELEDNSPLNYNFDVGDTIPVGSYPEGASIFGVLDMAGNVEEWVADWYAPDYYAFAPEQNPTGPEDGVMRVLRGGSYFSRRIAVLTTSRAKALPDGQYESVGFRVAQNP